MEKVQIYTGVVHAGAWAEILIEGANNNQVSTFKYIA